MAKGAAIKFQSYEETIPKLLKLLRVDSEIKKYDSIVLKVQLADDETVSTPVQFAEAVLSYILKNKNPVSNVFIAEGADGPDTGELFESRGFQALAEKHNIGLIDLNTAETEPKERHDFLKFEKIYYPSILSKSFIISLPKVAEHPETVINGSLSNMLGTFPAKHYQGFFSAIKNKIRKFPIKYAIHDILKVKMPDFAIVDNSERGSILAGLPLEMDKQIAKMLGLNEKDVPYLKLLNESIVANNSKNDVDKILDSE